MAFFHFRKIFIREEMYIDFKLYSDREALYRYMYDQAILKSFVRDIVDEDLQRLTQIAMIRITVSTRIKDFISRNRRGEERGRVQFRALN
jgi:topoisomerase-4 subunit A